MSVSRTSPSGPHIPGLRGFCAALLPPEHGGPDPGVLAAEVEHFAIRLPAPARWGLRAAATALAGLARATTGRSLAGLPVERRERIMERLGRSPSAGPAVDMLRTIVLTVAGAAESGASLLADGRARVPVRPDPELDITPSAWWPGRSATDVVVIGSGAGGAMAARTMARAGLRTVVVEEGREFRVEEFRTRLPLERFADLYRDAGSTVALGRPPIYLPLGRAVGGTTVVNSGTCYRTPEGVLRRWRDGAGLQLADPDTFAPHLDEAWATLGPLPVPFPGRNGELAVAGARALGWAAGPLMHNAAGCQGCCQSAIGCPVNAKSGVNLNALPGACEAGARIASEARVLRVLHERGRARGVLARRPDGSPFVIAASHVVVAAGAIETPPLLRRSGIGRHPHLGRNLSIHPALAAVGLFDEAVIPWRGALQSAGVEEFHEREGILLEATSAPRGMGWSVLPGSGRRLLAAIERGDHLASLGALIADGPSGRVLGGRRTIVRYDLAPRDGARLLRALAIIGRVLFAAGAVQVSAPIPGLPEAHTVAELDLALEEVDPRTLHLAAFHPTASTRAGADPERFPVDPEGRLRGVAGVSVADASILPSCPGVNPQVTIMALAHAVAQGIATS